MSINQPNTDKAGWMPIETAPRNGRAIMVRNTKFPMCHVMGWSSARNRWEGIACAPLRTVPVWWDEKAEQPNEWCEVEDYSHLAALRKGAE